MIHLTYRCDCCGGLEDVREFPDGKLWGRPMQVCAGCRAYMQHQHQAAQFALSINFGLSDDTDPAVGLERIKEIEHELLAKGQVPEAERIALVTLRRKFEKQLARRQ